MNIETFEIIQTVLSTATFVAVTVVGYFFKGSESYVKEKFKNLAQKEDLTALTNLVEEVKTEQIAIRDSNNRWHETKTSVYLECAEAYNKISFVFRRLPDDNTAQLIEFYSSSNAVFTKVEIIGSTSSLKAMTKFTEYSAKRFNQLMTDRMKIENLRDQLKYIQDPSILKKKNDELTISDRTLRRSCSETVNEMSKMVAPFVIEIRKDLNFELDENEYLEHKNSQYDLVKSFIDESFDRLDRDHPI